MIKNCLTCKHWQWINKTQKVNYRLLNNVSRAVGVCLVDNSYTTEDYLCTKLNNKGRIEPKNYEVNND